MKIWADGRLLLAPLAEFDNHVGHWLIRGHDVRRCKVMGPAVLFLRRGCNLERVSFGGPFETIFQTLEDRDVPKGVVVVDDCTFVDCEFFGVSLVGNAKQATALADRLFQ